MTRYSNKESWRMGFTTGSCAAGAAKSACLQLKDNNKYGKVDIPLPNGTRLVLPIFNQEVYSIYAKASVIKDSGDDPDVTNGIEIVAIARKISDFGEISIKGGKGVGIVTKKGLAINVGESAINPVPRKMIVDAVREVFTVEEIEIEIEVPQGEIIAKKTLNSRLGIIGGISILGTSGIVKPMSEEAFKTSILPELDQAIAYGHRTVVLTPGNYGYRAASQIIKAPEEAIIQMSNFVGFILEESVKRGVNKVLLLGHIGKLIKISGGIFHTHNRVADARMEILIAHAALGGLSFKELKRLISYPTVEGAAKDMLENGYQSIIHNLAQEATRRAKEFLRTNIEIGTIFTMLDGEFIGWDDSAIKIISEIGWCWPN